MFRIGHIGTIQLSHGPQQHRVPVKVEKPPLTLGESADVDDALRLDTHALKRRHVCNRRHDEVAGILEADEAPVEQVVDAGRQQQSVLPIEPLIVRRVPPRFAVAGHKVNWVLDSCDPALLWSGTSARSPSRAA
jgi:hypothetical protein